ncbi:EAL domain-containing protein [Lelliottia aquatilis]|uniref:EAL domain-containing protein n=1 Tax=Lelliottia aquatilis TaxID=2080838 RepID=UPI0015750384|nr:EAL domain-containing protein [Lelliottia aquatilis]NTZ47757.1 EAL domain-containing protein [Lelliottia aquatilis]
MKITELRLKKAMLNEEFIPFYQPIVSGVNGAISGCEVLARWLTPEIGLLQAGGFIEKIEHFGLTEDLTILLANDVRNDITELKFVTGKNNAFILTLNINLSMLMTIMIREYFLEFSRVLKKVGITVVFELTERQDIHKFPKVTDIMRTLTEQGMMFAVDDFGSGYACEDLAVAAQASFIKIDASYTADPKSTVSARFIDQTLELAHKLKARVIAEGVENEVQETWLKGLGIDFLQGYRYGRPMPAGIFFYNLAKRGASAIPAAL